MANPGEAKADEEGDAMLGAHYDTEGRAAVGEASTVSDEHILGVVDEDEATTAELDAAAKQRRHTP